MRKINTKGFAALSPQITAKPSDFNAEFLRCFFGGFQAFVFLGPIAVSVLRELHVKLLRMLHSRYPAPAFGGVCLCGRGKES